MYTGFHVDSTSSETFQLDNGSVVRGYWVSGRCWFGRKGEPFIVDYVRGIPRFYSVVCLQPQNTVVA